MNSTEGQLKEFVTSFIWQDLRLAILTRLSVVRNDLEYMPDDAENETRETARLRGRAFELRFLADLPGELISQIERGDLTWRTEQEEEPELESKEQELRNLEQEHPEVVEKIRHPK